MIVLHGKGVSPGIAQGRLYFYRRSGPCVARKTAQDPQAEQERVLAAQKQAVEQLNALAEKGRRELGEQAASLFETHALLAEDEDFGALVSQAIQGQGLRAEFAVEAAADQLSKMLAALDDKYMQARAADILDVAARLVRILTGTSGCPRQPEEPVILAADDLAPSETMELDKTLVLGLVLEKGSETSHTAILARTLGIPAVCGVKDLFSLGQEAGEAYLDGDAGKLTLQPDGATVAAWQTKQEARQRRDRELSGLKEAEDVTQDGTRLRLYCNIGSVTDLEAVKRNGGRGVGLFRSEFLFLERETLPDEEAQFAVYKALAQGMEGRPVIIRTLDLGSDKQTACLPLPREENPALGLRGVRVCLNEPGLFKTQLRAIFRASAFGRLAVMFPMVTSVWEVQACKALCLQVMEELKAEGRPFCANLEIGVMIETPAAVFLARELAALVDFFSVGTNDLTQYLLACDRQSACLQRYYDPHHPAILRALKLVVDAAHAEGKWVGICGELSSDVTMLPAFLELGVEELSVSPSRVLPVRQAWRALNKGAQGERHEGRAPADHAPIIDGPAHGLIENSNEEEQKWI